MKLASDALIVVLVEQRRRFFESGSDEVLTAEVFLVGYVESVGSTLARVYRRSFGGSA